MSNLMVFIFCTLYGPYIRLNPTVVTYMGFLEREQERLRPGVTTGT